MVVPSLLTDLPVHHRPPEGCDAVARAVFLNTAAVFAVQTRTDRDVMLNALPLPHVYGNVVMNGTFIAGATLVMMERFEPAVRWPRSTTTVRPYSTACRRCTR